MGSYAQYFNGMDNEFPNRNITFSSEGIDAQMLLDATNTIRRRKPH
jgi:hypothetical protein